VNFLFIEIPKSEIPKSRNLEIPNLDPSQLLAKSDKALIVRLEQESESVFTELFMGYRAELRRFIQAKIDPKLSSRIDGSDVIQEAFIAAKKQLPEYIRNPKQPFQKWLKSICLKALSANREKHLKAQRRSVFRETSSFTELDASTTPFKLQMAQSSPSSIIAKAETRQLVIEIVESMNRNDKQILKLVHIEDKSLGEAAKDLNISYEAVKKRYRRALIRLSQLAKRIS
jgi:RNA polymerase sigma-70 factor (ECF subfamily)